MADTNIKTHEPLFHIAKRDALPWYKSFAIRAVAILTALIVSGVVTMLLTGENPINVYMTMIDGAFGTERRIWNLLQSLAMLLMVSLAVTPAFRMKFWNIGAEGQALMAALATTTCMLFLSDKLPNVLLIIVMLCAAVVAGAVWAIIPAVFRAKWGTNETLFTLMMNYIAIQIVSYFSYVWSVPEGSGQIGVVNSVSQAGWLPQVGPSKYFLNVVIVLLLTVFLFVYMKYSKHGYEISVVGESSNTAKYIGVDVKKVIIRTMLFSGILCGVAGFLIVAGADHTVTTESIGGRGFTAIMVSWLAKFNPFYMILTSLLLVFFEKGATEISMVFGFNDAFAEIITGIVIFFIIGCEFFINYKIKFKDKEAPAKKDISANKDVSAKEEVSAEIGGGESK